MSPLRSKRSRAGRALFVLASLGMGCGSTPPPEETRGALADPIETSVVEADSPAPEAEPPAPEAEPPAPAMSAEVRGTSPACVFASISLDSRALPTSTTPDGFDFWVRGEADDLRRAAPPGVAPRMYTGPGGHVDALFDGATMAGALAACEQTVTAYMASAPNLPLIGLGSAAHVTTPCRSCD